MTFRLRPLEAITLSLLLGLLLGLRFAPSPPALLTVALVTLLGAAILARGSGSPHDSTLAILLAFVAAGGALGSVRHREIAMDCRRALADGESIVVSGVLGATTASAGSRSPLVPLEHVRLESAAGLCERNVRIGVPEGPALAGGASITGTGRWVKSPAPVLPSAWPGEPAYSGFVSLDSVSVTAPPDFRAHPLLFARGRAEDRLASLFPDHFGLAEGLLLGRRERIDSEVSELFVRAGLVHLLAISGAHVGLFAAMLLLVGGALRIGRDRVRIATIAITAGYLALIGAPGSAVRAGIMLALVLIARIIQRPSATFSIVAAAALGLIAWNPRAVLDPGVQLSFAGVGAIIISGRIPLDSMPALLKRGYLRPVLDAALLSAIAFLTTAPITAHHFGAVSPVAILANLPAVPLTSLALVGVVAAFVTDLVAFPAAALLADGAAVALGAVEAIARLATRVPYGYLHVTRPDWNLWGVVGLTMLLSLNLLRRLAPPVRWVCTIGAAFAVLLSWPAAKASAGGLEIHYLDVGQGDAIAVRTPANRWLLIDTGPREENYDAGVRRVLPFLSARGVTRLEAIILTHPHADHIGGAAAVIEAVTVGRIVEPGNPVGSDMYLDLLAAAERRGVEWTRATTGRNLRIDGVEIAFLWPDVAVLDSLPDANHASAVFHLRFGEFDALFTGDADDEVERRIIERNPELGLDVLKAGHHGSSTSSSAELLDATDPELVVISAGRRNRYGHPAQEVLDRLTSRNIEIARTDLEGTISLRVSPGDGTLWSRFTP